MSMMAGGIINECSSHGFSLSVMDSEADEPPEPPETTSSSSTSSTTKSTKSYCSTILPTKTTTTITSTTATSISSLSSCSTSCTSSSMSKSTSSSSSSPVIITTTTSSSSTGTSSSSSTTTSFTAPLSPVVRGREPEERKEEVEERKESDEGIISSLYGVSMKNTDGTIGRSRSLLEEKKSIVLLATALLDDSHSPEKKIAFNLGKLEMCADLSTTLKSLGHSCRVEYVSHANMDEVLKGIRVYETVFNICDGTDDDGVVGVSLVHKLEQQKIPFAGACSQFYHITSKKSRMKALFEEHRVPTMPYRYVAETESAEVALADGPLSLSGHMEALKQWPLFVKPDDAYGSMGVSDACVCRDQSALLAQCASLRAQGFKRLMVEGFLDGDEFSVLLTDARTYPAVRKVYLREGALCLDFKADWIDNAYEMVPVKDAELDGRLRSIAMMAYKSVGGNSFGRVDLRIHTATNSICVLEVNSQCGIGDNSTAWDILTGFANSSGSTKQVVAAQFLHQIVTHPRRGGVDLRASVLPLVRGDSGDSIDSIDSHDSHDSDISSTGDKKPLVSSSSSSTSSSSSSTITIIPVSGSSTSSLSLLSRGHSDSHGSGSDSDTESSTPDPA